MFPTISHRLAGLLIFLPLLLAGCGGEGDAAPPVRQPAQALAPQTPTDAASALPTEEHLPPTPEELASPPPTDLAASVAPPPMPVDSITEEAAATESIRLAANYTPLVQGTINAKPAWPVWYGNGKPVDGINCLLNGNWHKHMLISIYSNGKRLGFPDGIGRVHAGCYHAYETHVHDVTGIIHMESDSPKEFKLGQWFALWKQPLGRAGVAGLPGPVRFYIIENATIRRYDGDPAVIAMLPHREVLIVTGSTMTVAPKYLWPAGI